jgi:hypothetical protein
MRTRADFAHGSDVKVPRAGSLELLTLTEVILREADG